MSVILTKALVVVLVGILMIAMVAPQPAYAQGGLLAGITGILNGLNGATVALQNFINNVMRPILEAMRTASAAIQNILTRSETSTSRLSGPLRRLAGFADWCNS